MIITARELVSVKEIPQFNESGFIPAQNVGITQPFSYRSLIQLIKKTPEAIGILRAIQVDICSDGYSFEGKKVNVDKAEEFAKQNQFRIQHSAAVFDWLMLGNGAIWKGKISETTIKQVIQKVQAITGIETKESEIKQFIDEDVYHTKLLKHAPWSTMNIDLTDDRTSIRAFRQVIDESHKPIIFEPEEIIHGKFMEFDGKVYGFSPMESSINILSTLSLIKDLNGNFFQNGGVPDWMFILPKEMAQSPNVQKLEQVLRKYKSSRNKHGNLIFTGEVTPIQLNKFDKDMEFRQLAIYYTGILALAFNMPMARLASILGAEVSSGAAETDLSEAGYWRSISSAQDYWEDLLNSQLWEKEFKVKIKFNRSYLNDQIKEAQRDVQAFEVLNNLMLTESIEPEYVKEKLKIPDRYWTGKFTPIEQKSSFGSENGGSPGSAPKKNEKGDARQEMMKAKKKQAEQAMQRKERDSDYMEVSMPVFDELVQRWVKTSKTRDVNWYEENGKYYMMINTPDNKYLHIADKGQFSPVKKADWLDAGRKINGFVSLSGEDESTNDIPIPTNLVDEFVKKMQDKDGLLTYAIQENTNKLSLLIDSINKITDVNGSLGSKLEELKKIEKKIELEQKKVERLEKLKQELKGEL